MSFTCDRSSQDEQVFNSARGKRQVWETRADTGSYACYNSSTSLEHLIERTDSKRLEGMTMAELIPAASALIIHEGKILFVRSNTTQGQWGFPGGKREKEETPQQTASREVKEELGIDMEITGDLGSYVSIYGDQRFVIKCFVAEAKSVDLRVDSSEIIEAKWYTLKESLELNLTLTTREALQKFVSNRQLGEI